MDTPARVVVKRSDNFGMDWLVVEKLELLPVPTPAPEPKVDGGTVVGMNLRVRLTHQADGTPYPEPVLLTPNPAGPGMVDAQGAVSDGFKLSWGVTRKVEIEVDGKWIPVELRVEGVW